MSQNSGVHPVDESIAPPKLKNIADPLKLTGVEVSGIAAEAAVPGQTIKVWVRLSITSAEPDFHQIAKNLSGLIQSHASKAGHHVRLNLANSILLVLRPDNTADLWVDTVATAARIITKRALSFGQVVFESDIADLTAITFPAVEFMPTDRVIYIFREGWGFGVFCDFNPEGNLSVSQMETKCGTLVRQIRYRHIYEVLKDGIALKKLVERGWFPFAEILGAEFTTLENALSAHVNVEHFENDLIAKFDSSRLNFLLERWLSKPNFAAKEKILRSAVDAFSRNDPIACIKIVLTEIEGVLLSTYKKQHGKTVKIKRLIDYAVEAAKEKTGQSDSLLLPIAFGDYLKSYAFADFDPATETNSAGSRHAVGHGAADQDSYTQVRALQALLTLDQLAFYF